MSYGTFMQDSEVSDLLSDLRAFTQTIIGTDFKIGSGYFEFSGEAMVSIYNVPQFDGERNMFKLSGNSDIVNLSNFTTYLDFKYELPIIQGSYAAYRIDYLAFSKQNGGRQHWDDNVLRHSFALGYHITRYLLLRATASTQQVDNKNWNKTQRTLRLVLTAHY